MALVMKHLKRVPHILTGDHKQQHIQLTKGLLKTLAAACQDSSNHFIIVGKSWFHSLTDYETVW
jgi:hypothetical protein